MFNRVQNPSVIRQNGESLNGCYKRTKHAKFSEKRTFFTLWYAHARVHTQGVTNVRFSEKFGPLCFLVAAVLRFTILPYYRRIRLWRMNDWKINDSNCITIPIFFFHRGLWLWNDVALGQMLVSFITGYCTLLLRYATWDTHGCINHFTACFVSWRSAINECYRMGKLL